MCRVGLSSEFQGFLRARLKRLAVILLLATLFLSFVNSSPLAADTNSTLAIENERARMSEGFEPTIKLPAVLALDSALRSELYTRNSDLILEIPAVARLMTHYLASERLPVDDMIMISRESARLSEYESDLDITFREGDSFPLRYILLRMMFQNSDAAAVALAEKIAGSKREFVAEMQKTAAMLGMTHTTFFACDVVRAEREAGTPSAISSAISILDEHNAQEIKGAPIIPEAGVRVSTAKTTLRDIARLVAAIQANTRAKNILSLQEELVQVTLASTVQVVAMRSPASRLRTLSENRISSAWQMMTNRYSLSLSVGSTTDGIAMIAVATSLRQANMTQPMLQLYQDVNSFYTKSVLTRVGEKYPGAPEAAENGELFSLVYLDSVDYVHPKTDHFLMPKLDYIGNAPYPLPIQKGVMTGQVIFTLKDETRIPVRVGSGSDILASNNILSNGIQQMARNPNLGYSIVAVAGVLSLTLLVVILREIKNIRYWRRLKFLEDTVQSARNILVGDQRQNDKTR